MNQRSAYEPLIYALLLGVGVFAGLFWSNYVKEEQLNADTKVEEVMSLVQSEYVDSLSSEVIEEKAISEMLSSFDPHSVYIPSQYVELANQDLKDGFDGIGIEFFMLQDTPYVVRVLEGGPAKEAGVLPGDRFISVDTISLIGKSNREVIKSIKGRKNSKLDAVIYRKSQDKHVELELTRGHVYTPSVYCFWANDSVLYAKIEHFAEKTHSEFVDQIRALTRNKIAAGIILDMRNNPGGYLQTAIELLDEIVDGNDLLAYTENKAGREKKYKAKPGGLCADMKVCCLVNKRSASASEIVSGALQDLDRGVVIGNQTFGKGLVQETFRLSDGSQLRLTISRYYIPSGRSIQKPYNEDGYAHLDSTSIANNGTSYKTKNGREVKSNGGVSPDIFLQSMGYEDYRGIGAMAADLVDKHYSVWEGQSMEEWSGAPGTLTIVREAVSDSLHWQEPLMLRLAYQLYGIEEYYKMTLQTDHWVARAIAEVHEATVLLNP